VWDGLLVIVRTCIDLPDGQIDADSCIGWPPWSSSVW
jgi:hypothetical protein